MSDDPDTRLTAYLADHPRLLGVLFTMALLLSQAGSAAASTNVHFGP